MKRYPIWLSALWTLWTLALLALLALWWLGARGMEESLLKERRLAMQEVLPELASDFRDVERFGEVLLAASIREAEDGLSIERARQLRAQGEPFFRFYFVDGKGAPLADGDERSAPDWMAGLASHRLKPGAQEPFALRPLPPGYDMAAPGVDSPAEFLVLGSALSGDRFLLWELNRDYLFGDWLRKQLGLTGFAEALDWEVREWGPGLEYAESTEGEVWRWTLPTLYPEKPSTFGPLVVTLDNRPALNRQRRLIFSFLAAGLVVMLAFAGSLALSTRALKQREAYSDAKSRFVSMVGHELRTPVTAIEMYLEILREGLVEDPKKLQEYHRILARESGRLKNLVENLLTAGLLESKRLVLKKVSLELLPLLEEVIEGGTREGRNVKLESRATSPIIHADKDALFGVFGNLIQNALKYSPPDSEVTVTVVEENRWVTVTVEDRGEGLGTPNAYDKLFEPYYRAHPDSKGIGLGLALVRELVEAHGGGVQAEPRTGGGSRFTVRLPKGDEI